MDTVKTANIIDELKKLKRNRKDNKRTAGRVLIFAGSFGMAGASVMCVRGEEKNYCPARATAIIDYLNEKLKTNYKTTTRKTQDLIRARLNEGFTVEDFNKVIDNKYDDWINNPKMREYLRPVTLFSNKFESYLNRKGEIIEDDELWGEII